MEQVFDLDNDSLSQLIEGGRAEYVMHIYCKGTMFREVRRFSKAIAEAVVLPANNLRDRVEVDFFVCANAHLEGYENTQAHSDYAGYKFPVDKGAILAYGGQGVFYANKTPEELKAISSFMNIDSDDKADGPMYNDYDGDKITVFLSKNDYRRYQEVKKNDEAVDILHSAIVLPALMQAIVEVQDDDSEFKNRKWYGILKDRVTETKEEQPMRVAQKILENPLNRSFNAVTTLTNGDDRP